MRVGREKGGWGWCGECVRVLLRVRAGHLLAEGYAGVGGVADKVARLVRHLLEEQRVDLHLRKL